MDFLWQTVKFSEGIYGTTAPRNTPRCPLRYMISGEVHKGPTSLHPRLRTEVCLGMPTNPHAIGCHPRGATYIWSHGEDVYIYDDYI